MRDKILIIDGNSLINRAFYAIPPLSNKEGVPTNAVYGFINMLQKLMDEYDPKYVSVAFDLKAPTFRHKAFKDYKGTRKGTPDDLRTQIPMLKEVLDLMGIHRLEYEGYEADDLIGTMAFLSEERSLDVYIATGDKDSLQLVTEFIRVVYHGTKNQKVYTPAMVEDEFGISPKQVPDHKGLMGDSSDNIPGVPGVGKVTATKLLQQFGTLENLIQNPEEISNKRIRGLIEEHMDSALMSKRLATIVTHVPMEFELEELAVKTPDVDALVSKYKALGFSTLISKVQGETQKPLRQLEYYIKYVTNQADAEAVLKAAEASGKVAISIASDRHNLRLDNIEAIALATDAETCWVMDLREYPEGVKALEGLFTNPSIEKYGHHIKQDYLSLMRYGILMEGVVFDSYIALYLLEPQRKSYDLKDLVLEYNRQQIKGTEDLLGKGAKAKQFAEIKRDPMYNFIADSALSILSLKEVLNEELKAEGLKTLFEDIELPLIEVLASIEFEGFNVKPETLKEIDEELTVKIDTLTEEIYTMAGDEFNINSPKQLGVILFEKLGLPIIKKTKTGYSTSHDVLMKLQKKSPIIDKIIEYRTYTKLKSTYVDGLFQVINPTTGRIHSSLNQTVAVTGRLSSTDPNLQNIPIRLEEGREIRKVFIARDPEHKLMDADYSQIELRVLAHMSKDESLIKAFTEDIDIHSMTASQVFGVPIDEVTSLERSRAKEVNFGIVYGMSDFGLSENLKITRKMAKEYIDQYFEKYEGVRKYMDDTVAECRKQGYVQTIFNRRRFIPEINNKNFNVRAFGERTARNTPIQGSAADIIKVAMIKVYSELKERNLKSKLILQVHDELIIDVHVDEMEEVKEILVKNMEEAAALIVPLKVDMKIGESWYDTK